MGLVAARIWRDKALGIYPAQRIRIRDKKKQSSLDIVLEVPERWDERGEDDKTLNKLIVEVMLGNREATRRATWKRKIGIAKKL